MGGGNAQKSAIARAKNAEKAKAGAKGSQLKSNANSQSIICQVCRSTFICTSSEAKLREHQANKHDGKSFETCFPNWQMK